jgi:pimeloyl-ACP methyl ester carboxylesterase
MTTPVEVKPLNALPAPLKGPKGIPALTEWDADLLKAKERVGEYFCKLSDGRQICYFKDGNPEDKLVIAMHGGMEGKYKFLMRDPMPGIYLVSIDRPHYGGSSPVPVFGYKDGYTFENAAKDIGELADHLGKKEFIVTGHSVGTSWCMNIAAALPERVKGVILWSALIDIYHPDTTKADIKGANSYSKAIFHPKTGWCKCILMSVWGAVLKAIKNCDVSMAMAEECHPPCKKGYDLYCNDPFWICATLLSWQAHHDPDAIKGDSMRTLYAKWPYDIKSIKCPIYLYHGDGDYDMHTKAPVAINWYKRLFPEINVEVMKAYGHVCTVSPNANTTERFVVAVDAMPCAKD